MDRRIAMQRHQHDGSHDRPNPDKGHDARDMTGRDSEEYGNRGAAGRDRRDDRHGAHRETAIEEDQGATTEQPGRRAPRYAAWHRMLSAQQKQKGEGGRAGDLAPEHDRQRRHPSRLHATEEVRCSPAKPRGCSEEDERAHLLESRIIGMSGLKETTTAAWWELPGGAAGCGLCTGSPGTCIM